MARIEKVPIVLKILVVLLVLVVLAVTAWFLFAFAMTCGQPGGPAVCAPKESGSWPQSHPQSGLEPAAGEQIRR